MERSGKYESLFVYGTLRGGGARHDLMLGCRRLGDAVAAGYLYDFGPYPAFAPAAGGVVHGEVWRCPAETLTALDSYEGVEEGLFERIRIETDHGSCWTYAVGPRLSGSLERARIVSTGRWSNRGDGSDPP